MLGPSSCIGRRYNSLHWHSFQRTVAHPLILLLLVTNLVLTPWQRPEQAFAASEPGPTTRISVSTDHTEANDWSFEPSISAKGRHIAYESSASNLVPDDTNGSFDVFMRDRHDTSTERTSVASDNLTSDTEANDDSFEASVSSDGRYVAFSSYATNLVENDQTTTADIVIRDRQENETTIISVSSSGQQANRGSFNPAISSDGRYVVYESRATNLVSGDDNRREDVFLYDRQEATTTRVSVSSSGHEGDGDSDEAVISPDGRFVAFESLATNLVSSDSNEAEDVFIHDRVDQSTRRVSVSSAGSEADADSAWPSVSDGGRYVAFTSWALNLTDDPSNSDVYVRDTRRDDRTHLRG